ncbi:hypothetical protein H257_04955 [Aphanomyces astaci]|uniref:Uncharacterized protein n=1 Tax=Aphanomyces astaci TaxID=112090 RepID=W4GRA8_APHAT|nr:hypothetical protein H257_04955 [Aphanomyces astaci]ETV82255.1 hypothetical protein H257_04955 [Aphanomyces astaci]|eukprot:XP_009827924.1 hypothetical protein H257_04955 [Aphanomyces astaci]
MAMPTHLPIRSPTTITDRTNRARATATTPKEARATDRANGGAHPVPNCPKLKGISQEQVRQWLLDRDTYEEDLRAVCMRRNLEVWKYREGWKECFEDKRLLKQFMIMRKLRGDPKELDEANGVEADIPLLFHGIHMDMKDDDGLMDMKDDDCLSRVCKFLADCAERIEARVMKGHLKKPEMRKKIFKRLLEVVDPEPVRDACVLDMEKVWHPVEFSWESISELPGYEAKEVKNKIDHRKDDYSRQELRDVRPRRDDHERNRSQGRDRRDRSSNRANHETITQATPRYIATETVVVRTSDAMKTAVPLMDRPIANPSSKWDLRCDVDEAPLHPMEEFCTTAMGNETTGGDIHSGATARRKTV